MIVKIKAMKKNNMIVISLILNVIFVIAAGVFLFHKRNKILEKFEMLGGANLQKQLWPNLIRVS